MKDEIKITRLKKLTRQRNSLMKKVGLVDNRIDALLKKKSSVKKVKKKVSKRATKKKATVNVSAREAHPKPGSSPELLCKAMSSRPKQISEIAEKLGLTEGTVKFYIMKYKCFQSAGYGKGYIYVKKGSNGRRKKR